MAGWKLEDIAAHPRVQLHKSTTSRICQQPAKSIKTYKRGRKRKLTDIQQRELIRLDTLNSDFQRKLIQEVARIAGINASL